MTPDRRPSHRSRWRRLLERLRWRRRPPPPDPTLWHRDPGSLAGLWRDLTIDEIRRDDDQRRATRAARPSGWLRR
jgi:hypothetical protein